MPRVLARVIVGACILCAPTVGHTGDDGAGGADQTARVATLTGSSFPGWKNVPSARDIARAAPPLAMQRGVSGTTILFCTVDRRGDLVDCQVEKEEHPGNGLGEAALGLVGKFRMKATKADGTSVAGDTVKFPVRFIAPR